MKELTMLSLFDGSGGFPLAGALCGIKPVAASEIEPYPIAVTTSHFPHMKHLGDVSKIHGGEIEPVDVITFGSPCQDLSLAGKRAGLKHTANGDEETTRSGLFMEAIRIIKEMRSATNGRYPTFALWENVHGAFSSNNGEDFRTVLTEFVRIAEPSAVMPPVPKGGWAYADWYRGDGWSLAYRALDAQYWGVPQRRRRIFLVLDLGGDSAGEILFKPESLSRNSEPSAETREGTASDIEEHAGASSSSRVINLNKDDVQSKAVVHPAGVAPPLYAGECRYGGGECYVIDKPREEAASGDGRTDRCKCLTPWDCQSKRIFDPAGVYPTLQAMGNSGANNTVILMSAPVTFTKQSHSIYKECQVSSSLKQRDYKDATDLVCVPFAANQRDEVRLLGDKAAAVQAQPGMKQQTFVCISNTSKTRSNQGGGRLMDAYQRHGWRESDVCGTLTADQNVSVRGNTPLICFPYKISAETQGGCIDANE